MLLEIMLMSSIGVLGIFLGSQITEGVLFVPYWKALPAREFFELHRTYGRKIYQFFAPLTIIATLLPLSTLAYGVLGQGQRNLSLILMGVFTLLFFSTYYLFFKRANKRFAEASISHEELPAEIEKWGNWHWGRIVLEGLALVCAMVAMLTL